MSKGVNNTKELHEIVFLLKMGMLKKPIFLFINFEIILNTELCFRHVKIFLNDQLLSD